jgi:hypothetical protein
MASIIFSQQCTTQALKRISLAMAFLSLVAFFYNAYGHRVLKVKYVRGVPENNITFEEWNPINRITVIQEPFGGHKALRINYDSAGIANMFFFDGDINKVHFIQKNIQSFYYQIRKPAEILIIGAGGGRDVLAAYINGHKYITGVEINPTIVKLDTSIYGDFNGNLFKKPGINLVFDDGRNYVRYSSKKYDIIHIGNIDSWAASSSGAFTFSENTLYTVEAFKDYYRHLKDDGVLWLTRWRYNNDVESFRVFTTAVKTLEELGVNNPGRHMIVIAEKFRPHFCQAIILLKKTPFLPEEIKTIDNLRDKMNLEWLHHPEKKMNSLFDDYLFSPDKKIFLKENPLRADPITDNHPFFFNFLKPKHYFWRLPATNTPFNAPAFLFKVLFIIVSIMVFLTIFFPLMIFSPGRSSSKDPASFRGGYLLYFACLGLGFMLVEIPLIQKFILFLGQPLYAIAVILSSLLIFSGIGSLMSGKFSGQTIGNRLSIVIALLCLFLAGYLYGLPAIFKELLGSSGFIRVISSIMIIAPLGVMMGMALPLGIRLLEQDAPSMIPWVWGVNGACSVMGSIIAWGLSLNFGYNTTSWTAILVYGCAGLIMILKPYASQKS